MKQKLNRLSLMNIIKEELFLLEGAMKLRTADIAKKAGVSPATVSRVINHRELVRPETIKIVEKAMAELGYVPKYPIPESEPEKGIILVNCPQGSNPFYEEVIQGIISSATSRGYHVLLNYDGLYAGNIDDFLQLIRDIHASGIILLASHSKLLLDRIAPEVPLIQCCEYSPDSEYPFVSIDDFDAAQSAVNFLIQAGRNKIAFLNGPRYYRYARDRLRGFQEAMRMADLFVPSSWIVHVPKIDYDMAYTMVSQLFIQEEKPNAIFAVSDVLAAAAINAARKHGFRVPDDIMVVGFDNIPLCQMMRPTITTVSQPKEQMGFTASELLIESIHQGGLLPRSVTLSTELIVRESAVTGKRGENPRQPGN